MTREEAIKIVNGFKDLLIFKGCWEALETLIPEFAESEDERIRKALVEYFSGGDWDTIRGICKKKILAWLEKQKEQKDYRKLYEDISKSEWFKKAYAGKSLGEEDTQKEQKPAEWSEEDESIRKDIMCVLQSVKQDRWRNQMCDWLNTLPKRFVLTPKQECNTKYETLIDNVFVALMDYALCERAENNLEHAHHLEDTANNLKSLRPSWKPSEEQMGAIRTAIDVLRGQVYDGKELYPGTSHVLTMMLNYFQANNNDTKV